MTANRPREARRRPPHRLKPTAHPLRSKASTAGGREGTAYHAGSHTQHVPAPAAAATLAPVLSVHREEGEEPRRLHAHSVVAAEASERAVVVALAEQLVVEAHRRLHRRLRNVQLCCQGGAGLLALLPRLVAFPAAAWERELTVESGGRGVEARVSARRAHSRTLARGSTA
jgi:hypothetical protein